MAPRWRWQFSPPPEFIAIEAAIPLPRVTGPLPTRAQFYPFGGAGYTRMPSDLSLRGYIEEEYLVSGS